MLYLEKLTIRAKIVLLSLPLVLAALVVSGYFYYRVSSSSIISQTEIETMNLINQLSTRISERFDRASAEVRAISQLPSLPNYYFNREYGLDKEAETFRRELEDFMLNVARRAPDYATVRYIEAGGREAVSIINGKAEKPGQNKSRQDYFRTVAALPEREMLHRTGIEISEDTGGRIVRFAVQVYDDQEEFRGMVVVDYDFEQITNLITTGRTGDSGWVGLITPGGEILSHPQTKLIGTTIRLDSFTSSLEPDSRTRASGDEISMSRVNLLGWNYLVFLHRKTGLPWYMLLGIPASELYQPLRDVLIQVILVILFAALFSFAIASFASKRIYRVIKDIVTGARRVSEGDLKYRINTATDPDTGVVVKTFNGMVKSLYGQRLQMKHQLTEITNLKQYMDNLLRSILNAVVAIDNEGFITTFNPASERIFALDRVEVEGKHWTYLLPYVTGGVDTFKEIFSKGLTSIDQRIQIKNTEERTVPANINSSTLYDEEMKPRGLVTVWRDLSMVINLEKQLTRSSKLASLGEMSARVAHEINNPLAVISGHAQILSMELRENQNRGNYRQALDEISNQCQRIAKIVRQIREYSKPSQGTMKTLDINRILGETVEFSRFIASKNAEIITDLEDPLPLIYGDPDQLIQVFTNLVNNATQAFEKEYGGILRINTRWRRESDADIEWINIRVIDNGKGIPRKHLDMIFDPFFSTKSEGTGLGLAISQTIIEHHGGTIKIESEEGVGTTVIIELPIEKRKTKLYEKPAIGTEFKIVAEKNKQKE